MRLLRRRRLRRRRSTTQHDAARRSATQHDAARRSTTQNDDSFGQRSINPGEAAATARAYARQGATKSRYKQHSEARRSTTKSSTTKHDEFKVCGLRFRFEKLHFFAHFFIVPKYCIIKKLKNHCKTQQFLNLAKVASPPKKA